MPSQTKAQLLETLAKYTGGSGNKPNYAGQIKANYTNLLHTGFTAEVPVNFDSSVATVELSPAPTTQFPYKSKRTYVPTVYDPVTDKLKENRVRGQTHTWRVIGKFYGKSNGTRGTIKVQLSNPDSGFMTEDTVVAPQGALEGTFTATLLTIADDESLPEGRGYVARAIADFDDSEMTIEVVSLVRRSHAIESR